MTESAPAQVSTSTEWPLVSVIVPTRDRPKELHRAITSIVHQDYAGEVECIVVFDRSEPRLPEMLLPPRRTLRAVSNVRTPGLAGARNSGADEARGQLIAHCDDDDEWLPQKLTRQVALWRQRPDAVAISSGLYAVYGDRRVRRLPQSDSLSFDDFLLSRHMEIHSSNLLIDREVYLHGVGPVDEGLPESYSEDYEWLLRASRTGPVVSVPEPLIVVHWSAPSWFSSKWRTVSSGLRYVLDRYPEFASQPVGLARVLGQIAFALAAEGRRKEARRWAGRALRASWRERRAYLALAVSFRLVSANRLLDLARRRGKGI